MERGSIFVLQGFRVMVSCILRLASIVQAERVATFGSARRFGAPPLERVSLRFAHKPRHTTGVFPSPLWGYGIHEFDSGDRHSLYSLSRILMKIFCSRP